MKPTPMQEAARVVAKLVPGLVDDDTEELQWWRFQDIPTYRSLSSGEQAAYDLARELWTGGGTLPRFLAYIDNARAMTLLSAIHTALSAVWFPMDLPR